ncbi:MAG: hypothetical protein JO091_12855, partial [Acidobacteriaceae bacterium]|nr:hypothetical protein [Acidobacteriaceae bacterium]
MLLLIGLLAPVLDGSRLSAPIQRALESSLGRRVSFGKVHFTLFTGPGVSLDDVVISEDPRYGLEPFAYVSTLQAHLRVDKLLMGHIQFSSLRLVDPALNLVKRSDGSWNVVTLVERVGAPRRMPLNLFPAFEVTGGRIDFKLGTRKTTLYLSDADLAVYPQRSGKLYMRFSGSPARTDRAGNGFGHLRGTANWYRGTANADQLHADVTLDPSNLSELTTLIQGQDLGVHGTISSRAHIEGPATALRITGELRLQDVHRWDLLPSSGEDWRIRYHGDFDLLTHRLDLETLPWHAGDTTPVALQIHVGNVLGRTDWFVQAQLNNASLSDLLPLGRRMGLSLPENLVLTGALVGAVGYTSASDLTGHVAINNANATLPHFPPLHAATVDATVSADRIHLEPADLDTGQGTLQASGDYYLRRQQVVASLSTENFSVDALKHTVDAWFGAPAALSMFNGGDVTGSFLYSHAETNPPAWSGQFQVSGATLTPPGCAIPLENSQGRVTFDDSTFDLARFSATIDNRVVHAAYHYETAATPRERIHLEIPVVDVAQLETTLEPALKAQDLLARLRISRRAIPPWLAARNLDGDVTIANFSVNQTSLGPLSARFLWHGTDLQFTALQLNLPEGLIRARGHVNLASYLPRYRFTAKVAGFPWRGGLLNASGDFESSGLGLDTVHHLHAAGVFSGDDLTLSAEDAFSKVAGAFEF